MAIKNINEQLVQEIEDLNKDIRKLKRKAFWGKVVAFIAGAASGLIVAIIAL